MFKLKNVSLKPKLIGLFLIVGIVPLAMVGFWSSNLATKALMEKSYNQLEGVREIKKSTIETYFLCAYVMNVNVDKVNMFQGGKK